MLIFRTASSLNNYISFLDNSINHYWSSSVYLTSSNIWAETLSSALFFFSFLLFFWCVLNPDLSDFTDIWRECSCMCIGYVIPGMSKCIRLYALFNFKWYWWPCCMRSMYKLKRSFSLLWYLFSLTLSGYPRALNKTNSMLMLNTI